MEICRYCLLNNHTLPLKKRMKGYRLEPTTRCTCLIQRRATIRSRNPNTNFTPFISNILRRPHNRRVSLRLRTRRLQQTRRTKPVDNPIADEGSSDSASNDCPICLETVEDEDKQRLPCSHSFHKLCINAWLENSNSCPVCRKQIGSERSEARLQNITSRLRFLFSVVNFSQSVTSFVLQNIEEQLGDFTHYVYQ